MGQNPLSYYILYNESKHNILALVGKPNKSSKIAGCTCPHTLQLLAHDYTSHFHNRHLSCNGSLNHYFDFYNKFN